MQDRVEASGIDAFTVDDRLRLFHFAAVDKCVEYLWVLRAFERGRANYQVLLHAGEVRELLVQLAAEHRECPSEADVEPLLESLSTGWHVLDRSYDGARVASLAEYRNRHFVYQFTHAGYRAYRAVEDVLGARLDDASLSRLVFPDILADLRTLAAANRDGDAEEVYRKLTRLDQVLSDMAQRAARFYLMLGDLARTNDARPEVFLAHKDALLTHMRDFQSELQRYTPRLAAAVGEVEATGVDALLDRAAEADERLFSSPAERLDDWRMRWYGLVGWFCEIPGSPEDPASPDGETRSEADRLQGATVTAISNVLALLRRVTETRRGGVSRESQLRHLAAWFAGCPSDEAAHALFSVAFNLRAPRHVNIAYPDPELIPTRRSWWDTEPVEISRTLVETGKPPSPGRPAPIDRGDALRRRLRAEQLAEQSDRRAAARALAEGGAYERVLDEAETAMLLTLLDRALGARVPVSGIVQATGSAHGVRLTVEPHDTATTVETTRGRLHLDGARLAVRQVTAPGWEAAPRPRDRRGEDGDGRSRPLDGGFDEVVASGIAATGARGLTERSGAAR